MNRSIARDGIHHLTHSQNGCFRLPKFIKCIGLELLVMTGLLMASSAHAATYYVSASTGNNSYTATQAQNINTPWLTIQKAAQTMVAGDTCIIRAGTYRETVVPTNSGTAGAPITFQAYPGEVPIVDGTQPLTGWVMESTNIYYAPFTSVMATGGNQVFQNTGTPTAPTWVMRSEARWPDPGPGYPWQNSSIRPSPDWSYMTTVGYDSSHQNGWFTDSNLPSRPAGYWNGATINVVSGLGWLMKFPIVTGVSGSTVTTNDANGASPFYNFQPGNEYYITGVKGEMTTNGEWYYDSVNHRMYIYSSTGAPADNSIEAKTRNQAFYITGKAYINLTNLHIFASTIKTDAGSTNCTFDGLVVQYTNHNSQSSNLCGIILRTGDVLRNSDISFDSYALIDLEGDDIKVINNNLHDAAYIPTHGAIIAGNWTPANFNTSTQRPWTRELISHNTLHDSGMHDMEVFNTASVIEYNDMYNAKKLTDDGGIFYTISEGGNSILRYNLLHDSNGPAGQTGAGVMGIYLDSECSNWVIHHNLVWNVVSQNAQSANGIKINRQGNFVKVFNNSTWNTGPLIQAFNSDGEDGISVFNNLFTGPYQGAAWVNSDIRYNLNTDPKYVNPTAKNFQLQSISPAIDQGAPIPGITDGYLGAAPDQGAMEYGAADWTTSCGYSTTPPSPDPVYSFPAMTFTNQVIDGSFENSSSNWVLTGAAAYYYSTTSAWTNTLLRSGYRDVSFGAGTSEVNQTVTGLLPNHRYVFYAGVSVKDTAATVILGVRNYGQPTVESSISSTYSGWQMNGQPFITGPTSTSAQVYVNVTSPNGAMKPSYADDFCVALQQAPIDGSPGTMPYLEYRFDEASGSTAFDATTNGWNGTVSGTASWVPGLFGNALSFNGTTNFVTSPSIGTPSEVTVSCWAKSATSTWTGSNQYSLVSKRPTFMLSPSTAVSNGITYNTMSFYIYSGGAAHSIRYFLPTTFDITAWHQYAGVYSPSNAQLSIYVDGQLASQSILALPLDTTASACHVGKDTGTGGTNDYFKGTVDDVRIYNYALTTNQVGAIYDVDATKELHYKFDESAGSSMAWDCSGNYNWGTLTNMNLSTDWVAGQVNGALHFNGTNSYVVSPSIPGQTELTVACWAKSAAATWNQDCCWVSKSSVTQSFMLGPLSGGKSVRFNFFIGGVEEQLTYAPPSGFDITAWHHYVGVFSSAASGLASFYIDGVLQSQATYHATMDMDTGPVYVGVYRYTNAGHQVNHYFSGWLDDVRVYNRALSWDEIQDMAFQTSLPPYQ